MTESEHTIEGATWSLDRRHTCAGEIFIEGQTEDYHGLWTLALSRGSLEVMLDTLPAPEVKELDEEGIEDIVDAFQERMQIQIRAVMMRRMQEWQKKFPKRSLAFMDAMGSTMLQVTRTVPQANGENEYNVGDWHQYGVFHSWRARDAFAPLIDLLVWYNDIADQAKVTISDILVGEPFWPVHVAALNSGKYDPRAPGL